MTDIVVNLVAENYTFDEIGNQIPIKTKKEVFSTCESVSQSEFFNAGQTGLKPDYKLVIWSFEYQNEQLVEIDNIEYSVYRTFLRDDEKIELYLTKRSG